MRKKKSGNTLGENIKKHLERVKRKGMSNEEEGVFVVNHMIDTFFEPVQENGHNYFVRYTDLQRMDGRTLEVPDEIEIEAKLAHEK